MSLHWSSHQRIQDLFYRRTSRFSQIALLRRIGNWLNMFSRSRNYVRPLQGSRRHACIFKSVPSSFRLGFKRSQPAMISYLDRFLLGRLSSPLSSTTHILECNRRGPSTRRCDDWNPRILTILWRERSKWQIQRPRANFESWCTSRLIGTLFLSRREEFDYAIGRCLEPHFFNGGPFKKSDSRERQIKQSKPIQWRAFTHPERRIMHNSERQYYSRGRIICAASLPKVAQNMKKAAQRPSCSLLWTDSPTNL